MVLRIPHALEPDRNGNAFGDSFVLAFSVFFSTLTVMGSSTHRTTFVQNPFVVWFRATSNSPGFGPNFGTAGPLPSKLSLRHCHDAPSNNPRSYPCDQYHPHNVHRRSCHGRRLHPWYPIFCCIPSTVGMSKSGTDSR